MQEFNPAQDFVNDEKFFRCVPDDPNYIKTDGKLSSATFKSNRGCSVNRQGNRGESESLVYYKEYYTKMFSKFKWIVSVKYIDCIEATVCVKKSPSVNDIYHCDLTDHEQTMILSSKNAKKLQRNAFIHKN